VRLRRGLTPKAHEEWPLAIGEGDYTWRAEVLAGVLAQARAGQTAAPSSSTTAPPSRGGFCSQASAARTFSQLSQEDWEGLHPALGDDAFQRRRDRADAAMAGLVGPLALQEALDLIPLTPRVISTAERRVRQADVAANPNAELSLSQLDRAAANRVAATARKRGRDALLLSSSQAARCEAQREEALRRRREHLAAVASRPSQAERLIRLADSSRTTDELVAEEVARERVRLQLDAVHRGE